MKKSAQRILCVILSIIFILPAVSFSTGAADAASTLYGRSCIEKMANSSSLLFAYDRLAACMKNHDESTDVYDSKHSITEDELVLVYQMVSSDYPEIYWHDGIRYSVRGDGKVVSILPTYSISKSEATEQTRKLTEAADRLCSGLAGLSDYEIALALHDRLADNVEYVSTPNDQTAYGALVEGRAVCAGYAAAYQYLMRKMGLMAFTVIGASVDPSSGKPVGHAWNLVLLDGDYYYTDVTWDDQQANNGIIYHEFFNITTEKLAKTHVIEPSYVSILPQCTAEKDNYFVKRDAVVTEFDADVIGDMMLRNNYTADIYVDGDAEKFIDDYFNGADEIAEYLNVYGTYRVGVRPFINEVILTITPEQTPEPFIRLKVNRPEGMTDPIVVAVYSGDEVVSAAIVTEENKDGIVTLNGVGAGDYTVIMTSLRYLTTVDISFDGYSAVELPKLHLIGDINCDDRVNAKDSGLLKNILLGKAAEEDLTQYEYADVNLDGSVNTFDSYYLKLALALDKIANESAYAEAELLTK